MKQTRYDSMRRMQLEYHRSHPWRLSHGALYVPHSYADTPPDSLSYWDDVGFILNGRRIIVWWQHPRHVYANALLEKAWQEVGDGPRDTWMTEGGTIRDPSPEQRRHYDQLKAAIARLNSEGIDCDISMNWKWQRLKWAMGVSLVAPMQVRNENDLAEVADLARRLILWKTTLKTEFPDHHYDRKEWLQEHVNQ